MGKMLIQQSSQPAITIYSGGETRWTGEKACNPLCILWISLTSSVAVSVSTVEEVKMRGDYYLANGKFSNRVDLCFRNELNQLAISE